MENYQSIAVMKSPLTRKQLIISHLIVATLYVVNLDK